MNNIISIISYDMVTSILLLVILVDVVSIIFLLKSKKSYPYVMHIVSIILWVFLYILCRNVSLDNKHIVLFANLMHFSGMAIPYTFILFILEYKKDIFIYLFKNKKYIHYFYALYVFIATTPVANVGTLDGVRFFIFNKFQFIAYSIFLIIYISSSLLLIFLWTKKSSDVDRKYARFIALGSAIPVFFSMIFDILLPQASQFKYYWLGPASTLFLTICVVYIVFKYKFFDIKVIGSKFIKYFLFSLYSYIVFYSLVFIYIKSFGSASSKESYFLGIFAAPLFVYCLFKIENIANWLNKKIFGNLFIHKDVLNDLTLFMGENLDKREIIEKVERTLSEFLDSKVEILDNGTKASFTEVAKAQINKNQTLYFSEKQDKAFFSKDDISLVSNVVTQLAFALERSELYARVANYATDLEKEVEMKTIELKTANDSLLDLLRNKEEVLHIINHQLNTPISVIKSTAGMVRDGIWGMQKFYDITLKEVMNMEIILKDFWEAQDSRDIRSKLKLKKDSFSDLIKAILEEKKLNERVSSGQVKIVPGVEFTQKSFIVSMDRSEIEQVVSNYVENALFYTKQGEIHINCEDSRWNKIVFSVRDTGMGFSSEMLSKLFGKFIRSKSAELARPNGSGLGLYICRKIIEAHGGRVWAESPGEGMGATFYFELPTNT
jgi:signal transduction histidine kinase